MTNFSNNISIPSNKLMTTSFAGAMMSGLITDFVFKGINGVPQQVKIDICDIYLSSIQSGVSNISYLAALETLSKLSDDFKRIKEDPKNKSQAIVYLAGGSLGALYATGINYPIQCLRDFRKFKSADQKSFKMSFEGVEKFFADRVFGYIGFATSMGNICKILPKPKNVFHKWSQTHFLIQMSHLNGILTAYPYQMLRYNAEFGPYVKNHFKSIGRKMVSSDISSHLKREIIGIPFMAV